MFIQFALSTYNWTYDYALYDVPVCTIALLQRQYYKTQGIQSMDLSDIEAIDNGEI